MKQSHELVGFMDITAVNTVLAHGLGLLPLAAFESSSITRRAECLRAQKPTSEVVVYV